MSILSVLVLLFSVSIAPRSPGGYWTQGPDMAGPESGGLTAVLNDGRLLVAGGEAIVDGFPVRASQIYDPATDSWSFVAPMHHARIGGTATTLKDGRVLVVGGLGNRLQPLRTAEVFDPRTNSWTEVAALPQTRLSQSASLLPDGQVLIVGGIVGGTISRSVLLFDPATLTWSLGAETRYPHAQQSDVPLGGGQLLIVGGYGGAPEIYDPDNGRWTPTAVTPLRTHPVVLRLHDGSILLAAGTGANNRDLRSARVLDRTGSAWRSTGSLHKSRNQAAGAVLPDGRALVAGGEQVTGHVLRSAELYDPVSRRWGATGGMLSPRDAAATLSLPDGRLLVCGGMNYSGVLGSCETYHP